VIAAIEPLGCSFKGSLSYVESGRDGKQHRVAWAEFYNLPTRNLQLAACFMGATANASVSGTRTPVYFFSVSFDIDDPVDEAMMRRVARRTLQDMGLEEHEPGVTLKRRLGGYPGYRARLAVAEMGRRVPCVVPRDPLSS
jgi:hypothetical protein